VPQARRSSGELLGGGRQAGGQQAAVQPHTRADLLGRGHPAPGLGPIPAEQIRERGDRVAVAPLGEHAPAHQIGHDPDHQPVQPPRHALAHRQHRQRLVRGGCRARGNGQRLDRLAHEAVCGDDRGARHPFILVEYAFDINAAKSNDDECVSPSSLPWRGCVNWPIAGAPSGARSRSNAAVGRSSTRCAGIRGATRPAVGQGRGWSGHRRARARGHDCALRRGLPRRPGRACLRRAPARADRIVSYVMRPSCWSMARSSRMACCRQCCSSDLPTPARKGSARHAPSSLSRGGREAPCGIALSAARVAAERRRAPCGLQVRRRRR
jgi:hypothetical protein